MRRLLNKSALSVIVGYQENTVMVISSGAGGGIVTMRQRLLVIASTSAAGGELRTGGPRVPAVHPDLTAVRALAECGELAAAASRPTAADGRPLPAGPAGELAREIARGLVEAGFPVHHCAGWDPQRRIGGVCVRPVPVQADPAGAGAVIVSWAVHDLLALDPAREAECEASRGDHEHSARRDAVRAGVRDPAVRGQRGLDGDRPPAGAGGLEAAPSRSLRPWGHGPGRTPGPAAPWR